MEVNSSRELDSETAVIEVNEMPVGMQADAVRFTVDAMNRGHDEGIMATYVKRAFDKTYEPSWHCVVGRNFGSSRHTPPIVRTYQWSQPDTVSTPRANE
ncbi:dynein light chain LC8-type, partial [Paragonimus westermani]